MFESIPFQKVAGDDRHDIRLLALSTCGFCRRGQEFLEAHGLGYSFVHLDTLDPEVKTTLKQAFKEKYGVSLSYPALVVGDAHVIGFIRRDWEDLLGLPHDE